MDLAEFYEDMTMPVEDDDCVSLTEHEDGSCPFYVDSPPGCKIYECRPSQCRTYPMEWNNPGEECPGFRKGNGNGESENR
jgi:Fe-S-cluster containining protein